VQPLRNCVLASLVLVSAMAVLGCQKGSDSTPPAAAVGGAAHNNGGEKAELKGNSPVDAASEAKAELDSQHPSFAIDTTAGKITVRLDAEKAPLTVENFRDYVARGHYDLTIFHQIVKQPVQLVLGGVYTADLKEKKSLTPIRNEADNGLKNRRGTIAMVRRPDDEDSATCQFFFNLSDNDSLNFKPRASEDYKSQAPEDYKRRPPEDYGYCVFGEVTAGMDVLDRIAKAPVHDSGKFVSLPVETVAIRSIREIK